MNLIHFDQLEYCCTGCREFNFHWMLPSALEVHALNDCIKALNTSTVGELSLVPWPVLDWDKVVQYKMYTICVKSYIETQNSWVKKWIPVANFSRIVDFVKMVRNLAVCYSSHLMWYCNMLCQEVPKFQMMSHRNWHNDINSHMHVCFRKQVFKTPKNCCHNDHHPLHLLSFLLYED